MNSVESKTISIEDRQAELDKIILEIGNAMVSKEFTVQTLHTYLHQQKKIVGILKRRTVLNEDTFVVQCVSKTCFDVIIQNTKIFKEHCMKGDKIYVLTPKMLTKFPYDKVNTKTLVGMEKHHVVELRTLMNKVGLEFKDTYKNRE